VVQAEFGTKQGGIGEKNAPSAGKAVPSAQKFFNTLAIFSRAYYNESKASRGARCGLTAL
jgi:hypothetical protein